MGQRIVFEFIENPTREPEKWAKVKKIILDAGGTHLSEPHGIPPHIMTAVLPNEVQARKVIALLRTTDGVDQADLDAMSKALGGNDDV